MELLHYLNLRNVVLLLLCFAATRPMAHAASFSDEFTSFSDSEHVIFTPGSASVQLVLDQKTAAGFGSNNKYLFGQVSAKIKLIHGNSAGTVLAYYMTSKSANHDELDFEFLGNKSGQPYAVQTNIYANGIGGREQRILLWFDPTTNFHTYTFLWNKAQIVFYVDNIPIRVYKNNENLGVAYPSTQPMGIYSSLWNGDQWATEGGAVKLNWTYAPFITTYESIDINACVASGSSVNPSCITNSAWNQASFQALSNNDKMALQSVKRNYMMYDYCDDRKRYASTPVECQSNTV